MPVSMFDSTITTALRNNLSSNSSSSNNNELDLHNKLAASAKHVLMNKIEFEEVSNYKSSFDQIKSKYTVLKAKSNFVKQHTPNDKEKTSNGNSGPSNGLKNESGVPIPKQILFSRENVQIGWKSTSRKWQVGVGMTNVGNTCYLNSTLQALFHVPALANWLMSDSIHRENCEEIHGNQGGCIICAMGKTLIASQSNQQPIKPWLVYSKLRLVCKHLVPGRQEDAHEFLRYLIEAMEKAFLLRFKNSKDFDQLVKETTPLNQILGGYIKTAVRCLTCGHCSTTFQHFEDILLDIRKSNSVEEALDGYFARERLEDMGYRCESCKKKVSATKQFCLERAPVVLCIQLKRFSMMGGKINKHVTIKQKLDLSAYSSKKTTPLTYKLVSMVTHLGSSQHCGHYTAVGVTDSGVYYQFDDSSVRSMSIQNALSTNAYIIFYELDDVNNISFDQNKILKETIISKTSTDVKARNDTITTGGFTSLANFKMNPFKSAAAVATQNNTSIPSTTQIVNNSKQSPDKSKIVNFPTNGFTIKEKTLINNNSPVKNINEIKTICRNGNNLINGKQLGSKLVIHFKDKKEPESSSSDENKTFLVNGKNATNVLHKKAINSTNIIENSEKKSTNKCSLPCMPKLIEEKSLSPILALPIQSTKVKSLVPYDDDDDSDDSSTETIKTKVGIWEVTDDSMPSPILNGRTNCSSNKFKQNGNKSENSIVQNGIGKVKQNQNGTKEDTVSQLLKLGHRGYGANVTSWNGESANITKEIIEEKREDRKRQKADDSENDIDRGRSKKLKSHKIDYGRDNPEFNPFQEHQTQQQSKRNFSHNNGNNSKHYTGHIYRQSAHFKHFRGGRHRGSGFQNSNRQGHRNHFQYKNS